MQKLQESANFFCWPTFSVGTCC